MPGGFDGSGNFNRVYNWTSDATSGIKILASRHDEEDNNFAQGLGRCITRNGESPPTADIPMGGFKIVNLAAGTTPTDAVNLGQLQSIRTFSTGITLSGAGTNTRLEYPQADMSFFVRSIGDPAVGDTAPRFVWNNQADGLGTDIAKLDDVGNLTISGNVTAPSNFVASSTNAILAATGAGIVHLRPNGATNSTGQAYITTAGDMNVAGSVIAGNSFIANNGRFIAGGASPFIAAPTTPGTMHFRPNGADNLAGANTIDTAGTLTTNYLTAVARTDRRGSAGVTGQNHNFYWTGGGMEVWVGAALVGSMSIVSDYRIKKDVAELGSTWNMVKALRPVSFTHTEFTPPMSDATREALATLPEAQSASPPLVTESDEPQWGFVAHELQETLLLTAATGVKDMEDGVQSLNLAPILAATVKALQEAMSRIEALEAA